MTNAYRSYFIFSLFEEDQWYVIDNRFHNDDAPNTDSNTKHRKKKSIGIHILNNQYNPLSFLIEWTVSFI